MKLGNKGQTQPSSYKVPLWVGDHSGNAGTSGAPSQSSRYHSSYNSKWMRKERCYHGKHCTAFKN